MQQRRRLTMWCKTKTHRMWTFISRLLTSHTITDVSSEPVNRISDCGATSIHVTAAVCPADKIDTLMSCIHTNEYGCMQAEHKTINMHLISVHVLGQRSFSISMNCSISLDLPLNVCSNELLIICHSWTSPDFVARMRCCFDGATTISRIGPVPDTVIVRICDGSGAGSHPVRGTSNGTVYPSHQAVAERTVMLNSELSFSSCSLMGRSQEIT